MSTITAILEPDADSSLHLPVTVGLGRGKIKVVAQLTAVPADEAAQVRTTKARDWARLANGIVRPAPGESADDARMAHYAAKYDVI